MRCYFLDFAEEKPLPNKNDVSQFAWLIPSEYKKILEILIAENIEMRTPRPKVSAKPLMIDVPKANKIIAVMIPEKLESRMANQARE